MKGPVLVALGAFLWATDAPFRVKALGQLTSLQLVGFEHLVGLSGLAIALVVRAKLRRGLFALKPSEWFSMIAVGAGASAGATLFFTSSFAYINPSLTILLQKLQPILVIGLARAFLGERTGPRYWLWAALAIASAFVLSFPTLDLSFLHVENSKLKGVLYALGSVVLWASATVLGRHTLSRVSPVTVTTWRYAFGLVTIILILVAQGQGLPNSASLTNPDALSSIIYIGLVPGLLAMLLYYQGLSKTRASVATLLELVYPLSAVAINAILLGESLAPVQYLSGAILLVSAHQVSRK